MKNQNNYLKTFLLALALVLTSVPLLKAQIVSQQWAVLYDNAGLVTTNEASLVDNNGNTYMAGEKTGNTGFPFPYLIKYNSAGTFMYQRTFTPAYSGNPNFRGCRMRGMAFDNSGNILMCGIVDSAYGYIKGVVIKFSPAGDSLWGSYTGIGDTIQYAGWNNIKIDNSGNIYVSGANFIMPFTPYYLTAKYSPAGTLMWIKRFKPATMYSYDPVYFSNMEIDNSGNIVVATTLMKNILSSSLDYFVYKYNNNGVLQWSAAYNGPADGPDAVTSMALDGSGNPVVFGTSQNVAPYYNEWGCVKFDAATGSQLWSYRTGGTGTNGSDDAASKMTISTTGDVYLTGSIFNLVTGNDGMLVKLNSAGIEQWRKGLTSVNDEYLYDVKTGSGFVYVTGGINPYSPNGSVVTCAYSATGDSLWSTGYHATNRAQFSKFLILSASNIYVCGDESNNTNGDAFIVKYGHITGIQPISGETPGKFSLNQNYPNPFNPSTKINYQITNNTFVSLKVYDILGKEVAVLVNENQVPGKYEAVFDAVNLSSGIYFYKISASDFTETRKMNLVK